MQERLRAQTLLEDDIALHVKSGEYSLAYIHKPAGRNLFLWPHYLLLCTLCPIPQEVGKALEARRTPSAKPPRTIEEGVDQYFWHLRDVRPVIGVKYIEGHACGEVTAMEIGRQHPQRFASGETRKVDSRELQLLNAYEGPSTRELMECLRKGKRERKWRDFFEMRDPIEFEPDVATAFTYNEVTGEPELVGLRSVYSAKGCLGAPRTLTFSHLYEVSPESSKERRIQHLSFSTTSISVSRLIAILPEPRVDERHPAPAANYSLALI
jgi:hypothetical protein